MAQQKLGTKRTCHSCQTKYYDFDKPTPVCPKCGSPAILTRPWEMAAKNRRPAGGLGAALGMLSGGADTDTGDDLEDTFDSLPSAGDDEDGEDSGDSADGDGDIEPDAEDEYLPTGEAKAKPPAASPEDLDDDSGLDEFEGYEIYDDDGIPSSENGDDQDDDGGDGLDEDFDGGGDAGDDEGFEPEPEPEPVRKPRRQARH